MLTKEQMMELIKDGKKPIDFPSPHLRYIKSIDKLGLVLSRVGKKVHLELPDGRSGWFNEDDVVQAETVK